LASPVLVEDAPLLLDVKADSRERLLQVAIHLFARDGLDGVSLKTISDAAGNRNKSAVGYHFSGKQGLVDAVLERLHADLAPKLDAQLSGFEQASDDGAALSVDEIVLGLLTPLMRLYALEPNGQNAIKVLARLMHEPVASFPEKLGESVRSLSERAFNLLQRLLPEKRPADLELHLQHAVMATVNGLALQRRFVAGHRSRWSTAPLAEIFLSYAGYVAAGIAGRPLELSAAAKAAWTTGLNAAQNRVSAI
jgi:AcrR family transcriptional regulator